MQIACILHGLTSAAKLLYGQFTSTAVCEGTEAMSNISESLEAISAAVA